MNRFQPSPPFLLANRMVGRLIRSGLPMGIGRRRMALLTVRGRKTGRAHSFPIVLEKREEGWLLVAVYGVSDWARNLEAAGEATVTSGGQTATMRAKRLEPEEAGVILRDSITSAPALVRRMTRPYFDAEVHSDLASWQRESLSHPVFVLSPAEARSHPQQDMDLRKPNQNGPFGIRGHDRT